MKIFLASDHGGFELKKELVKYLGTQGYRVNDLGPYTFEPEDDYPDFGFALAQKVAVERGALGILLCRTGGGMAITANKVRGARAIVAFNEQEAQKGKETNLANILVLAADFTDSETARKLTRLFVETPYTKEERHLRRINKIKKFETTVNARK